MITPAELRVTMTDEYDGTAMVTAQVTTGAFSGNGTACIGRPALLIFASELEALAEDLQGEPEIAGGYWDPETGKLQKTLLWLRLCALDRKGHLGVEVEAGVVPASNELVPFDQRVRVAFAT